MEWEHGGMARGAPAEFVDFLELVQSAAYPPPCHRDCRGMQYRQPVHLTKRCQFGVSSERRVRTRRTPSSCKPASLCSLGLCKPREHSLCMHPTEGVVPVMPLSHALLHVVVDLFCSSEPICGHHLLLALILQIPRLQQPGVILDLRGHCTH